MNTPPPIERIPDEIIQEISTWASSPVTISQLSRRLRRIAFDTPTLWQVFYTTCRVYRTDSQLLVRDGYLEHLDWWYTRLGNKNELAFKFELQRFWRKTAPEKCVPFDQQIVKSLFRLFARARYLYIEHDSISFLDFASGHSLVIAPWPFIESLTFAVSHGEEEGLSCNHIIHSMVETHKMSALRRIQLERLVLTHPLDERLVDYKTAWMWNQLTQIRSTFMVSRLDHWKGVIGELRAVESANLTILVREDDLDLAANGKTYTMACLRELRITVDCFYTVNRQVSALFEGLHFPALETFQLIGAHLTFDGFHRLVAATPLLERIRLASLFPTTDTESSDYIAGFNKAAVQFPTTTTKRLVNCVPHLKHFVIDIPTIHQFNDSLRPYVDGLRQCGWLEGSSWTNGPPIFDLCRTYWSSSMEGVVDDLYEYLSSDGNASGPKISLQMLDEHAWGKSSCWDAGPLWEERMDLGLEFQALKLYTPLVL